MLNKNQRNRKESNHLLSSLSRKVRALATGNHDYESNSEIYTSEWATYVKNLQLVGKNEPFSCRIPDLRAGKVAFRAKFLVYEPE